MHNILPSAGRQIDFTLFVVKAESGELVAFTQAIVNEVFIFTLILSTIHPQLAHHRGRHLTGNYND